MEFYADEIIAMRVHTNISERPVNLSWQIYDHVYSLYRAKDVCKWPLIIDGNDSLTGLIRFALGGRGVITEFCAHRIWCLTQKATQLFYMDFVFCEFFTG